jgi:SAM-dependent MidA family methyltransferase
LANELLDNLPFGIAEHDGTSWRVVLVDSRHDVLVEVLGSPVDISVPGSRGSRVPLQTAAAAWVDEARASITHGRVVAVDYVMHGAELAERGSGWLRTFRQQQRGGEVLDDLGSQDITSDVLLDSLPAPSSVQSQAAFLAEHGIGELVEEGRRLWERHASAPNLAAIAGRSRINEHAALTDLDGLGGFMVMQWLVE